MTADPTINPRNRLWTPWRMSYVGGSVRESGCIFCNRLESDDDVGSLIIYRGRRAFVILNLYPYNTGHLMVVPNAHVQDPSELDQETHGEMAALVGNLTGVLRHSLSCDGFNVGMNIGDAAGAGIAEHLHQHIVPRWIGDANFMPIVGSTKVLPELLSVTYGKVRAEVERGIGSASEAKVLALVGDQPVFAVDSNGLPVVALERDVPVWRSAIDALSADFVGLEIVGWAGPSHSGDPDGAIPALALRARAITGNDTQLSVIDDPDSPRLAPGDRGIVERGLEVFRV